MMIMIIIDIKKLIIIMMIKVLKLIAISNNNKITKTTLVVIFYLEGYIYNSGVPRIEEGAELREKDFCNLINETGTRTKKEQFAHLI